MKETFQSGMRYKNTLLPLLNTIPRPCEFGAASGQPRSYLRSLIQQGLGPRLEIVRERSLQMQILVLSASRRSKANFLRGKILVFLVAVHDFRTTERSLQYAEQFEVLRDTWAVPGALFNEHHHDLHPLLPALW
jgi:hypothetical protein